MQTSNERSIQPLEYGCDDRDDGSRFIVAYLDVRARCALARINSGSRGRWLPLVAPFARRAVKMPAKRLVEVREVVEAQAINNFRDIQRPLIVVAQCCAARIEPVIQYPAAKRRSNLAEPGMKGPHRKAQVVRRKLR